MYYLNKAVFAVLNPASATLILLALSLLLLWKGEKRQSVCMRRCAGVAGALAFAVLLFFSLPLATYILGMPLEKEFPVTAAADVPEADAIVVLGGGMCANTNSTARLYPDMGPGADRVWHAARLYHAGKAPFVIASGIMERESTRPLLVDFGIPEGALIVENDSLNTEENAAFTERVLREKFGADAKLRILLVTSAWHMRRSAFMFKKYAPSLEIICAPADYDAMVAMDRPLRGKDFIPAADAFSRNATAWKEIVGFYGYKWFRR